MTNQALTGKPVGTHLERLMQPALETVATSESVNGKRRTSAMASVSPTSRVAQRSRVTALRWAAVVGAMIILGTGGYSVYQRLDAERQRVDALAIARAERVAQMAREAAEAERKKRAEAERRRREAERRRVQEEKRRKAEVLRGADEEAWKHATTPPITIAKLRAYLVQNPHGNYHDAAQAKISAILKKSERDVADCSQNNDIDRAIVGCTSLLRTAVDRLDPKNRARIYNTRGSAYGKKKQYDRAIADLTKSIELDPGLAWAHYNRGTVYQMKGLHDLAIADFTQAIQLNPRFTLAYNNRGVAYRKKGKRRRAVADYRKALQIDPSYQFAMHNLKLLGVRP